MLRQTTLRRIKPYLHAFSPGARPSEKGMLYRNSNMNAHARVATIQRAQRTLRESRQFLLLLIPDQIALIIAVCSTGAFAIFVTYHRQCFSTNTNKQRWMAGAMNQHELFQRNDEMEQIFAIHGEAIDNTRSEIVKPSALNAVEGYSSSSGQYSA